jgi:hypothetical protein
LRPAQEYAEAAQADYLVRETIKHLPLASQKYMIVSGHEVLDIITDPGARIRLEAVGGQRRLES